MEFRREIKVFYPGRFQPFCLHHYNVYKWLQDKFNTDITIVTSDKVDIKSPFNFVEKSAIINKYGINTILSSNQTYNTLKLCEQLNLDPTNTISVVAIGEKDKLRLKSKTNYYLDYEHHINSLEPVDKHSYYIICPNTSFKVCDIDICGTSVRNMLSDTSKKRKDLRKLHKSIFGWNDRDIETLILNKLQNANR